MTERGTRGGSNGGNADGDEGGPVASTAGQAAAYQRLRAHLTYLKLPTAAEQLPAVLDTARAEQLSVTAALERLLGAEVSATEDRRMTGRLRFASLPAPWTLDELDYDANPGLDRALITDLASLRFITQASNVLLIGPPGVGKTHIAVGLARKAAEAGYRTYFTTAADLAARCHRAALEGRWATTMRFYAGPTPPSTPAPTASSATPASNGAPTATPPAPASASAATARTAC